MTGAWAGANAFAGTHRVHPFPHALRTCRGMSSQAHPMSSTRHGRRIRFRGAHRVASPAGVVGDTLGVRNPDCPRERFVDGAGRRATGARVRVGPREGGVLCIMIATVNCCRYTS